MSLKGKHVLEPRDGMAPDSYGRSDAPHSTTAATGEEFYRHLWEEQMEVNARKDKFLAVLSHELRNPLAPLLTAVNLLQERPPEDPVQASAVQVIERQTRQLAHLVDDLFEVSRFTAGKILLRKETVDLRVVVERALEVARPLIDERGHDLQVSLPDVPLWLHADPQRLEQAFLNLFINAAKYTPDHGRVWVQLTADQENAVLRVRDSGRGISPELLPVIFDFFTQGDSHPAGPQAGLGVGLSLVKSFVDLHGGRVRAHSEGVGRGADFTVEVPGVVRTDKACARPLLAKPPHSLRVLVVDDHADAATSLKLLLQLSSHTPHVAYTGLEAIETAKQICPDVILLDIGLPDMSGYDVAQRLRKQPETQDAVIIALTGFGNPSDREQAESAGCDSHLIKPVDGKRLQDVLAEAARAIPRAASIGKRANRANPR
jgi:CheY-like chemotaxis protein/two-component sensor histidine kinase